MQMVDFRAGEGQDCRTVLFFAGGGNSVWGIIQENSQIIKQRVHMAIGPADFRGKD